MFQLLLYKIKTNAKKNLIPDLYLILPSTLTLLQLFGGWSTTYYSPFLISLSLFNQIQYGLYQHHSVKRTLMKDTMTSMWLNPNKVCLILCCLISMNIWLWWPTLSFCSFSSTVKSPKLFLLLLSALQSSCDCLVSPAMMFFRACHWVLSLFYAFSLANSTTVVS